jgi:DNA-binding transcriptional LysR family regulator
MDLRQLRYFAALAETGSFHRAAEKLNMSQPPLTVAIRKLEQQLGARLFLRGPRGVELTDAGRASLPAARVALAAADDVREAVRLGAAGHSGRLRLGFIGSATSELLPNVVAAFSRKFPDVDLTLREMTSTQVVRDIAAGELEAGLVRLPILDPAPVRVDLVERDELVIALRSDHPLAKRPEIALAQLSDQPFIVFNPVSVLNPIFHLACRNAGFSPRVEQDAMQAQTVLSLVEAGLGAALVPARSARRVPETVHIARLVERIPLEMGVAAGVRPSKLVRNFVESAKLLFDTVSISPARK